MENLEVLLDLLIVVQSGALMDFLIQSELKYIFVLYIFYKLLSMEIKVSQSRLSIQVMYVHQFLKMLMGQEIANLEKQMVILLVEWVQKHLPKQLLIQYILKIMKPLLAKIGIIILSYGLETFGLILFLK